MSNEELQEEYTEGMMDLKTIDKKRASIALALKEALVGSNGDSMKTLRTYLVELILYPYKYQL